MIFLLLFAGVLLLFIISYFLDKICAKVHAKVDFDEEIVGAEVVVKTDTEGKEHEEMYVTYRNTKTGAIREEKR